MLMILNRQHVIFAKVACTLFFFFLRCSDKSSKHCKLCDKCVIGFDHHCRWLNTCIGKRNYPVFLIFLNDTFYLLIFSCLVKVYLFIDCFVEIDDFKSRGKLDSFANMIVFAVYWFSNAYAHASIVLAFAIIELVVVGSLVHLVFFHYFLSRFHLFI
jgi:hypothetical protein